jgi:hypothetical protein
MSVWYFLHQCCTWEYAIGMSHSCQLHVEYTQMLMIVRALLSIHCLKCSAAVEVSEGESVLYCAAILQRTMASHFAFKVCMRTGSKLAITMHFPSHHLTEDSYPEFSTADELLQVLLQTDLQLRWRLQLYQISSHMLIMLTNSSCKVLDLNTLICHWFKVSIVVMKMQPQVCTWLMLHRFSYSSAASTMFRHSRAVRMQMLFSANVLGNSRQNCICVHLMLYLTVGLSWGSLHGIHQ